MQLREMLAEPLGLRLLHGEHALDRRVDRACVTDMPDPAPFVTPGALVCTGLVWRRGPRDSDPYIGLLAEAGAAAIAAGRTLHGHVPDDVITACRAHGLPLLEAPRSLPFSRIIEHLAARRAETRLRRVESGFARQRRLLAAVADGGDAHHLLTEFATDRTASAWLLTATGALVAGTAPLADTEIDTLIAAAAAAPRLPLTTSGGYTIHSVGSRLGDRITLWYLVVRAETDTEDIGSDLAPIAELYRMRHRERLRLRWELSDHPIPDADAAVAVVADTAAPRRAEGREILPESDRPRLAPEELRVLVHDILPGAPTEVDRYGRVVAWTTGSERDVAARLTRHLNRLRPAVRGFTLRVGVSAARPGESPSGAVASAAAAASALGDAAVIVRIAEVDSVVGLLTAVPDDLQRRFAARVLGPLLEYDRRTGTGLLRTLEVFLDCAGSWRTAADRMHLHLNTIRYRIGRVEELTGRDLGRLDDRLDLYLAVRAYGSQTAPV
ncbi:PucR family transcriptional regulator ligand-binding domain-containing protein [Nocardia sp. NPDC004068]|uniref:helix-turn-helix domain-containing protein n=1 Tax=Nocardia sp. NPDC004068 TaxID=3364303 RepID=UPI0036A40AF7